MNAGCRLTKNVVRKGFKKPCRARGRRPRPRATSCTGRAPGGPDLLLLVGERLPASGDLPHGVADAELGAVRRELLADVEVEGEVAGDRLLRLGGLGGLRRERAHCRSTERNREREWMRRKKGRFEEEVGREPRRQREIQKGGGKGKKAIKGDSERWWEGRKGVSEGRWEGRKGDTRAQVLLVSSSSSPLVPLTLVPLPRSLRRACALPATAFTRAVDTAAALRVARTTHAASVAI